MVPDWSSAVKYKTRSAPLCHSSDAFESSSYLRLALYLNECTQDSTEQSYSAIILYIAVRVVNTDLVMIQPANSTKKNNARSITRPCVVTQALGAYSSK